MASRLAGGLVSGAVGTTALNMATYLDMTVRGRPASEVPAKGVEVMAKRAGVSLGEGDAAEQRKQGAGALMGYVTGLTAGVAYSLVEPLARRLPRPLAAVGLGLGVMAATDAASTSLGTTDPRQWSAVDWVSDVIPHVAYGAAAVITYDAMRC
jgi:hypothetical protein